MMTKNPQARQDFQDFLQRLKRYQKARTGTYALVVEMLTACSHGSISSQQLLTSLHNILCDPKVLQATSALLSRLCVYINVARVHAGPTICSFIVA
jgi:hypothetical protein